MQTGHVLLVVILHYKQTLSNALHVSKFFFLAVCPEASDGEILATKSFLTCYNRPSTTGNFQFFCNSCMTKLGISMAESKRIKYLGIENDKYKL